MAANPLESRYQSIAKNAITEKDEIGKRKNFSPREVGLTHPDNSSFIRLTDAGDIEIFAAPGVGLVISGSTRSISIFADNIRLHTKEDGLKWNSMDFNHSADSFTEPALVKSNPDHYNPAYINVQQYLDTLVNIISQEEQQDTKSTVTIDGKYSFSEDDKDITGNYGFSEESNTSSLFTADQITLITSSWNTLPKTRSSVVSSNEFMDYIANLMQSGYTFNQAKDKAIRDKSV